ncbi:helix-turn-helix domain-containing protein, partial [Streptomyces sp. NPDC058603]
TPKERAAAGVQLTNLGLPASEIARIFAVTPRTVTRWRAAARATQTT